MRYVWRLEGPTSGPRALTADEQRGEVDYNTGRGLTGAYMAGICYLDGFDGEVYYDGQRCPCPHDLKFELADGSTAYLNQILMNDMYFGFSSVEQAQRWWFREGDLHIAHQSGFKMVAMPVEDLIIYREFPSQLVYRPKPWGKGDCPVIRRVYFDPTWIHQMSQEEIEAWIDEQLERRQAA